MTTSFAPDQWLFAYSNAAPGFIQALESAARQAPILDTGSEIVALAHFTRGSEPISRFRQCNTFSWTNRLSQTPLGLGQLTGLHGVIFTGVCVIRVAVVSTRVYTAGHMQEYAIDRELGPDQFVYLPLKLVTQAGPEHYDLV